MRFVLLVLLALAAGCPGSLRSTAAEDSDQPGSGTGGGADGLSAECQQAADCVAAGPKCCDCPTHAVPINDPAQKACSNVDCPTPTGCGSPMEAACIDQKCELVCSPVACSGDISCPDGFATDENGCLTCSCAARTANECSADGDCARVRADCCGCAMGGEDTAVPTSQAATHDAQLMCPQNPSCPGTDTCAPDLAARCIAGACTLASGPVPSNACGRSDLPPCASGEVCTVNANDQATMHGVGVCQQP